MSEAHGSRRRRIAVGLAVLAAAAILGGIALVGSGSRIQTPYRGRLFLAAGRAPGQSSLFEMDLRSLAFGPPLAKGTYVSEIAARRGWVVLTGAQPSGAGFATDHLFELKAGRAVSISGLGAPNAYEPAISYGGLLAFTEIDSRGASAVRVWDPAKKQLSTVVRDRHSLDVKDWLRDNSLVLVRGVGGWPKSIEQVKGGQVIRKIPWPRVVPGAGPVKVSSRGVLAISGAPPGLSGQSHWDKVVTVVRDFSRVHAVVRGWAVLDWSPDGRTLLLVDGKRLGALELPGPGTVKVVAEFPRDRTVWFGRWAS